MTIEIVLNGEPKSVPGEMSVQQLLQLLEIPADRVAVELNGRIVRQPDWPTSVVGPHAQVEIVQFVGGG